jgi:predicted DNA-binding transcriptional regulator AlpA
MTSNPHARIPLNEACKLLGVSRITVNRKIHNDPTFPRPIKDGVTRQAPVYFVLSELESWIKAQMDARGAA